MGSYHDFQWASETLATARRKADGKPVQNNTRLFERGEGHIAVKLHAVDVVTINADGTWTLRAEGWHTVTTLERIRGYSPAQLFSERGEWFIRLEPREDDPRPARYTRRYVKPFAAPADPGPEPSRDDDKYGYARYEWYQNKRIHDLYVNSMAEFGTVEAWHEAYLEDFRTRRAYLKAEREWDQRNRIPFYDGITVDSNGFAPRLRKDGPSPAKLRRHEAKVAKMKGRIDKYVDGFIEALKGGKLSMPGNGDCWFCLFKDEDGKTWGDMGDNSHLIEHMKDRYYVPSLATNALLERGYRPEGVYIWLDMDQDKGTMGKPGGRYDGVKRDLVKYMSKRLIPQAPTS